MNTTSHRKPEVKEEFLSLVTLYLYRKSTGIHWLGRPPDIVQAKWGKVPLGNQT
jgi:hypothetical protein